MLKLVRFANIVVNVVALCEKHSLKEEDLPVVFSAILCSHLRFVPSMAMVFCYPDKDQRLGWDQARGDTVH